MRRWALTLFLILVHTAAIAETDTYKPLLIKPIHYSLDITLNYQSKKMQGRCRVRIANASKEKCASVPLILYRLLKVSSIRNAEGTGLRFRQEVVSFQDRETMQTNFVEVALSPPLAPGKTTELDIDYAGYILGYAEAGKRYVKDRIDDDFTIIRTDCLAYPQLGYPSWKANSMAGLPDFDYDLSVTAPKSLIVANGGKFVGQTMKGDTAISSYRSIKPSWRIDIALAKYRLFEDPSRNLRVFSLDNKNDAGAQAVLHAVSQSMALFTSWFGPLRGDSGFSIIEVPAGFGGQADATCILMTPEAFHDRSRLYHFYHEVSHLWNVKSLDPLPPRFESEGLAEFLQYLLQEKLEEKTDALLSAEAKVLDSVREYFVRNPEAARTPMIDFGRADITELSYTKGMLFFDLLFRLMGEKDFLAALASFDQKFAANGATAQQFLDHMAAHSSVPLEKLFREWVAGAESSSYILDRLTFNEISSKYR